MTSKARTRPLVLLCVTTVMPSLKDEPTMTMSLTTSGVECRPTSPVSRSICWPVPVYHADLQVDHAVLRRSRADRHAGVGIQLDQAIAGGDVR